jgi:hypothetical protein
MCVSLCVCLDTPSYLVIPCRLTQVTSRYKCRPRGSQSLVPAPLLNLSAPPPSTDKKKKDKKEKKKKDKKHKSKDKKKHKKRKVS